MKINFSTIIERKDFFDTLNETKKVTYNWGHDVLMCKDISITGEDFIRISGVMALTSADIVFALCYNYIEVAVIVDYTSKYATFKNEKELKNFLEGIDVEVKKRRK